jgi:Fe2+ or Zn2+ uptake regulation protein
MDELPLITALKNGGYKLTALRQKLIRHFTAQQQPASASELLATLHQAGLLVNKTSVYRELATLEKAQIIQAVQFDDRSVRYELAETLGEHHHHLICRGCRRIEDVACNTALDHAETEIAKLYDFRVERHALEFFGLCAACQQGGSR